MKPFRTTWISFGVLATLALVAAGCAGTVAAVGDPCVVIPPTNFKTSRDTTNRLAANLTKIAQAPVADASFDSKFTETIDATFHQVAVQNEACALVNRTETCAVQNKAPERVQLALTEVLRNSCVPVPASFAPTPNPVVKSAKQDWVFKGTLTKELRTDNHGCVGDCTGEPTRTSYRIELPVPDGEKLDKPKLECIAGPCQGWHDKEHTIVDQDGRRAVGTFDMWTNPQTWRLSAEHYALQ